MRIRFWGARGSIPGSGPPDSIYGSNTPCVQVISDSGATIILDAGTGIRRLGHQLIGQSTNKKLHILLSHFHWDHIQGLPFFLPLYQKELSFEIYSFATQTEARMYLASQMSPPFFIDVWKEVESRIQFHQISKGALQLGEFQIEAIQLNHPGGSNGYRIECDGTSLVYATDHEHGLPNELERIANRAQVLIYDSHYRPGEYEHHRGWGHSTAIEGAKLASRCHAEKLICFHHAPDRTDAEISEMLDEARRWFPNVEAASESLTYSFTSPISPP